MKYYAIHYIYIDRGFAFVLSTLLSAHRFKRMVVLDSNAAATIINKDTRIYTMRTT